MRGPGNISVRRVDPSRIVQGRYERPEANNEDASEERFPDPGAEAEEEEAQDQHESAPPRSLPEDEEHTTPRLLADRPVLRWLRTGDDEDGTSTFDRFQADTESEETQQEIAEHFSAIRQHSLRAITARAALPEPDTEDTSPDETAPSDDRSDGYETLHDTPESPGGSSVDLEG